MNYRRALQEKLARTISQGFQEVEQVRVHLVIPEKRLFGFPIRSRASM